MRIILFTLLALLPSSPLLAQATPAANKPAAAAISSAKVVDLRVERMTNPTAVNHPLPRFGWRIETEERGYLQTAYHLLAASTPELLSQDKGDLWDSGEKPGRRSQFINFGGAPLQTGQVVHWKIKSKDRSGKFTPWSDPANFSANLSGPPTLPSPLFLPVSESPRLSSFECSDPNLNRIFELAAQKLHEISSVRDGGLAMRAAAFHQEIHPRARAWLHHMNASVDAAGFYPATLPSDGTYGSTQSDAAISAIHATWWMTGDRDIATRSWAPMNDFIRSLKKIDPTGLGNKFGEIPDDSFPLVENAPVNFVHQTSQALSLRLLGEMATIASQNPYEGKFSKDALRVLQVQFQREHLGENSGLKHQNLAYLTLALRSGLLTTEQQRDRAVKDLLKQLDNQKETSAFSHGPFAASALLSLLGRSGNQDRGLEIVAKQDPEALQATALVAISEWLMAMLVGIDTLEPGFGTVGFRPVLPSGEDLSFAKAQLDSPFGLISAQWSREGSDLVYKVSIPPNVIASFEIPVSEGQKMTVNGALLEDFNDVFTLERNKTSAKFRALSGTFEFKIAAR